MISIWEKETFFAPQDIIIIGSGFVSLWAAFHLKKKQPKLKVTILERGIIPTGASTRNAGFACFGSLSELMHDAQTMGIEKTLQLVEMRFKGMKRIQKYFSEEEIDLELCGGYELYHPSENISANELADKMEYLNSLLKPITDVKHTFRLADDKISAFGFGETSHLIKNNLEGYLHSGKLLQSLLHSVHCMGVQVLNNITVTGYEKAGDHFNILSENGFHFQAKKLLICTNAFTRHLVPDIDIKPARGQVILTSPISNLPWKGTFHSEEGYYYFRNLGNRVLLGGARNKAFEDEETEVMEITEGIQNELERYLSAVVLPKFAGTYTIDHRWSGIMAMGSEKMPIIKEIEPNVFCAVRMSGMGVALAPIIGQKITKMMN